MKFITYIIMINFIKKVFFKLVIKKLLLKVKFLINS